jgi:hypothetical protein
MTPSTSSTRSSFSQKTWNRRRLSLQASVLSTVSLGACLAFSSTAHADCAGPPAVVWSYPADGQTDVPTNAVLIIAGSPKAVALGEVALEPSKNGFVYALGNLSPKTEYTIRVDATVGASSATDAITFTTGEGPATGVAAPEVSEDVCSQILAAQGCFDTGAPRTLTLAPDSKETPLAWGIAEVNGGDSSIGVWPAGCGPIKVSTYDDAATYSAQPLLFDGVADKVSTESAEDPSDSASGGCSISARPPGGLFGWILLVAAVAHLTRVRSPLTQPSPSSRPSDDAE